MNHRSMLSVGAVLLASVCAPVVAELSTNEMATFQASLAQASLDTQGLFEAGPLPPTNVPSFTALQNLLTAAHAEDLTNLLTVCGSPQSRKVMFYAFQAQSPEVYMTLLERVPPAVSAQQIDLQDCFSVLFPQGDLAGIVPYNYQNPRMTNFVGSVKTVIQNSGGNAQLRSDLLQAIELIQSGQMREAFLGARAEKTDPPPLPALE